jgi:50S ribosomal subunit-associated GTPase HflX
LTKTDLCTAEQLQEAKEIVHHYSPFEVIPVSTMSGGGIEELRSAILTQLHGPPVQVNIIHPEESSEIELAALVARVHRDALVIDIEVDKELTKIYGWIDIASQSRLTKEFPTQINISGKS